MPKIASLILFSTTHCHLCDEAVAILDSLSELEFTVIEISDSATLIDLYGTRIPVLQRTDNQVELDWPFNRDAVLSYATVENKKAS